MAPSHLSDRALAAPDDHPGPEWIGTTPARDWILTREPAAPRP